MSEYPALPDLIQRIPPQHSALLPSEALAFVAVALLQNCDVVIESGRRFGYSTDCLIASGIPCISIDVHRDPEVDARFEGRARLIQGDGRTVVPKLAAQFSRPAVLLDGPKGDKAYAMLDVLETSTCFVAIHDAHPGSFIERVDRPFIDTANDRYLSRFGHVDKESLEFRGYGGHSEILCAANNLAFFFGDKWV